jgi:hypothetical protein
MIQIDIYFTVSRNSLSYVRYSRENYLNLCAHGNSLNFYYLCLDSVSFRRLRSWSVNSIFLGELSGSLGHSIALDAALKLIDRNNISILSDTDVAIVAKDWDVKVREVLLQNKINLFGTQLERVGGFSSGDSKFQQYKGKPSTTWFVVSPGTKVEKLSTRPEKASTLTIDSQELSEIFGLPIGFELVRETGWQIPLFIKQNELSFKVLDHVKPTDKNCVVLRGLSSYHDEFHLENEPFLVHQRGSMTHLFRHDKLSKEFYDAIDEFLGMPEWSVQRKFIDRWDSVPVLAKRFARKLLKNNGRWFNKIETIR